MEEVRAKWRRLAARISLLLLGWCWRFWNRVAIRMQYESNFIEDEDEREQARSLARDARLRAGGIQDQVDHLRRSLTYR